MTVLTCVSGILTWSVESTRAQEERGTAASEAGAGSGAQYSSLIEQGLRDFNAGRYREARASFERAHALEPNARTLRALGVSDLALDNYTSAKRELDAALVDSTRPLTPELRREVTNLLDWMRTSLSALRLEYTPSHARASVDGKQVDAAEIWLEPAEHRLRVEADGYRNHERTFKLDYGQQLDLHVDLAADTEFRVAPTSVPFTDHVAESAKLELWPWVGSAGVVFALGGAALFIAGLDNVDRVEHARRGSELSELMPAYDRARWMTASGIAIGAVGLAAIAGALILLVLEDDEGSADSGRFRVTARDVRMRAEF